MLEKWKSSTKHLNIKVWPKVKMYCEGKVERVYKNMILKNLNYFFFKQLFSSKFKYVQCTFCIMDLLVNFNSELILKHKKEVVVLNY